MLLPNWWMEFLPRELWGVFKTFYIYEQDLTPTGAVNGRTDVMVTLVEQDSDFLCVAGVALFTTVDNLTVGPGQHFLVRIFDSSGAPLNDESVPISHLFGSAQRPAWWLMPKLFTAGGSIRTEIRNVAAAANNIRLGFWGIRCYRGVPAAAAEALR